jgi:hypothetical protein
MVDIVVFTIDFLKRVKQALLRIYKRIFALHLMADKLMWNQHRQASPKGIIMRHKSLSVTVPADEPAYR